MTFNERPSSRAQITAMGTYVPEKILANADFERMIDTDDEWIVQRTGIRERRVVVDGEYTSDLAFKAVEDMQARYNISVEDIDMILCASTTSDYPFPTLAAQVQAKFNIPRSGALDVHGACAGFVYALQVANAMITAGGHRKILVIGAETLSRVTDYSDRSSCILFGDAAGAFLLERVEGEGSLLASHNGADGHGSVHLYRTGLRKEMNGKAMLGEGKMIQNGPEVYRFAVTTLSRVIPNWLRAQGLSLNDIQWFVPHSANLRILESATARLNFPMERTLFSGEFHGNTSAASIPLAVDLGVKDGRVQIGDNLLLYGFGGGLVHAGAVIKWTI
ncbi:ketoacyl-ACP synthase III [Tumebacillus sp. ITR2]|uniref:Beta-ketoacyl-[acyl-carrier-protein] synthase III n=1 Tax=Tumebacillus amylolyticus TaxID=2801339 RepID=A0ABS1J854_9BACL|nr:ketoacyl-ACP synthase III [Tumebacillus amylolyticus]MBL0386466.1 ketoacyl-ACP synthase III [Tumebacillus amylolyticus]